MRKRARRNDTMQEQLKPIGHPGMLLRQHSRPWPAMHQPPALLLTLPPLRLPAPHHGLAVQLLARAAAPYNHDGEHCQHDAGGADAAKNHPNQHPLAAVAGGRGCLLHFCHLRGGLCGALVLLGQGGKDVSPAAKEHEPHRGGISQACRQQVEGGTGGQTGWGGWGNAEEDPSRSREQEAAIVGVASKFALQEQGMASAQCLPASWNPAHPTSPARPSPRTCVGLQAAQQRAAGGCLVDRCVEGQNRGSDWPDGGGKVVDTIGSAQRGGSRGGGGSG